MSVPTLPRPPAALASAPPAAAHAVVSPALREARARAHRHRKLRLLVAAGLAGATLLSAGVWFLARSAPPPPGWARAERRPLPFVLCERGLVSARMEKPVYAQFNGTVVWKIEEGTCVEKDAVIVRFDSTQAQTDLEKCEQDLFGKQEAVRLAKQNIEDVRKRSAQDRASQDCAVQLATLDRDVLFARPKDEEKKDAEWQVESAKLAFDRAERDAVTQEELNRLGFVSLAVLKEKRLALAVQRAELAKTKILRDLVLAGPLATTKSQAQLTVAEAGKRLETARVNQQADLATAQAGLELAQVELDNYQWTLNQKRSYLAYAEVKAPCRGRVAFVDVYKGHSSSSSPIQIGETRVEGQDLCKIADTSELRVKVCVNEMDVRRVAKGQAAQVTLPALPGRTFRARVAEISEMTQDKNAALSILALRHSGEAFVNVAEARLDFVDLTPDDRAAMRLNFSALVYVDCGPAEEAVAIPWEAVRRRADGSAWVVVRGPKGQEEERAVRLGRGQARFVQVLEGVAADEEVQLPPADEVR